MMALASRASTSESFFVLCSSRQLTLLRGNHRDNVDLTQADSILLLRRLRVG